MSKKYRHELKFVINSTQAEILKYRLSLIMDVDTNSKNEDNTYFIRSLYFDDVFHNAYYEMRLKSPYIYSNFLPWKKQKV